LNEFSSGEIISIQYSLVTARKSNDLPTWLRIRKTKRKTTETIWMHHEETLPFCAILSGGVSEQNAEEVIKSHQKATVEIGRSRKSDSEKLRRFDTSSYNLLG
jgi:hypothetical protein